MVTAFAGLPPQTLAWPLAHGEPRACADGETIIGPGGPANFTLPLAARPAAFVRLESQQTTLQLIRDVQETDGCISRPVDNVKPCSHPDHASGFKLPDVTIEPNSTLSMPGFQLHQENTCLTRDCSGPDLDIAQQIIRQHGGRLEVTRSPAATS